MEEQHQRPESQRLVSNDAAAQPPCTRRRKEAEKLEKAKDLEDLQKDNLKIMVEREQLLLEILQMKRRREEEHLQELKKEDMERRSQYEGTQDLGMRPPPPVRSSSRVSKGHAQQHLGAGSRLGSGCIFPEETQNAMPFFVAPLFPTTSVSSVSISFWTPTWDDNNNNNHDHHNHNHNHNHHNNNTPPRLAGLTYRWGSVAITPSLRGGGVRQCLH